MSSAQRLAKIEKALGGDGNCRCPENAFQVWFGPDGSDPEAAAIEPPELQRCPQCGGWPALVRVFYGPWPPNKAKE